MDFTKFVDLLERKTIYFARSDLFDDQFEGSVPARSSEVLRAILAQIQTTEQQGGTLASMSKFLQDQRLGVFLNCWHMNEHESAAMWRLYARTNEAIAIRSSYQALHECLSDTEKIPDEIYIGVVKYIDYTTSTIPIHNNLLWPFAHKRLSFAHERELRAVIVEYPVGENDAIDYSRQGHGKRIPIDIDRLISAVYVAPTSPEWFADLVRLMLARYGLAKEVVQSALDAKPLF